MKTFVKLLFVALGFLFMNENIFAQTTNSDFIDLMREGGKIYVVYFVLGVILLGVFIYLILLERKVARLEKSVGKK